MEVKSLVMIYTTGVVAKIGASSVNCTTVSSGMKAFTYDEVIGDDGEGSTPAMVINSTTPHGYNPGHQYVKMTLQMTSTLFKPLLAADGTAPTLGTLQDTWWRPCYDSVFRCFN